MRTNKKMTELVLTFSLGNVHVVRDVADDSRGEIRAMLQIRVAHPHAAMLYSSALIPSIVDNVLELLESFARDHGAAIHTRADAFCGQGGSKTEGTNAFDNERVHVLILRRMDDEAFDPNTVLPGILAVTRTL